MWLLLSAVCFISSDENVEVERSPFWCPRRYHAFYLSQIPQVHRFEIGCRRARKSNRKLRPGPRYVAQLASIGRRTTAFRNLAAITVFGRCYPDGTCCRLSCVLVSQSDIRMFMTEQDPRPQHHHNDTLFEIDSESDVEVLESEELTSTSKDIPTVSHVTMTSLS